MIQLTALTNEEATQLTQVINQIPALLQAIENLKAENHSLKTNLLLYTKEQVAQMLNVSVRQIETWVKAGRLRQISLSDPDAKRSKVVRFSQTDLSEFIYNHSTALNVNIDEAFPKKK
nr:helix-turn-helix domain-containing protein [uncultured Arsenicibacter sp.]